MHLLVHGRDTLKRFGAVVPAAYLCRVVDAPAIFTFGDWPASGLSRAFDKVIALLTGA